VDLFVKGRSQLLTRLSGLCDFPLVVERRLILAIFMGAREVGKFARFRSFLKRMGKL
jgi:hypothetical protein